MRGSFPAESGGHPRPSLTRLFRFQSTGIGEVISIHPILGWNTAGGY